MLRRDVTLAGKDDFGLPVVARLGPADLTERCLLLAHSARYCGAATCPKLDVNRK
jgi:hypothetical protein